MGVVAEDVKALPTEVLADLLELGRLLVTELDLEGVLDRVLQTAREQTGASYAAIGVLNGERDRLSRFLTLGISEQGRRDIGALPVGKGLLGALISSPVPLRLTDVREDPRSFGFPDAHPSMTSFLGVPITIRGKAWGNIYLSEKAHGHFSQADEDTLVILADWAAIAIDNSRRYEDSERRRLESERATRHLRVTRDVAVAIGRETDLGRVLELVVERGRALVAARATFMWVLEGEKLVLRAASADSAAALGLSVHAADSQSGVAISTGRPVREAVRSVASMSKVVERLGSSPGEAALIVPLLTHGAVTGVLVALGTTGRACFTDEDEALLETFAAGAAGAIALAESVEHDRLRSALESAEAERTRWARELHDETLQTLAGLRVLLGGALRRGDHKHTEEAVRRACESADGAIANLRSLITELRPATLDEMGLRAALESLLERQADSHDGRLLGKVEIQSPSDRGRRIDPTLENAVYRIVQEALTNINKHAEAETVWVTIVESDEGFAIEIRDDGGGFDHTAPREGFGLTGMKERVALAGGTLGVSSGSAGTVLSVWLPLE